MREASHAETLPARFRANARRLASQVAHDYPRHGQWFPVAWATMAGIVEDLASGLVELGHQPSEPVAIYADTRREWTYFDLAIMCAGGVSVGLYPSLDTQSLKAGLASSQARVVVVDSRERLDRVQALGASIAHVQHIVLLEPGRSAESDARVVSYEQVLRLGRRSGHDIDARIAQITALDAAMFLQTSGATGEAKLAMLTHGNLAASLRALASLDVSSDDVGFCFLPLAHALPRVFQHLGLWLGMKTSYGRGREHLVDDLIAARPTFLVTPPRVLEDLYSAVYEDMYSLSAGRKLLTWASRIGKHATRQRRFGKRVAPALEAQMRLARRLVFNRLRTCLGGRMRQIFVGGGVIAPELVHSLEACGVQVAASWSMTETCGVGTMTKPGDMSEDLLVASVGRPLPGMDLRLGTDGQLLVRGGGVFSGYYRAGAATSAAFTSGGYLRTGDIARVDARGCYYIVGRQRDLIVTRSGASVAPGAIESLVCADPRITQAMIVGHGRPHLVALVAVHASLRQIFDIQTIEAMVEDRIAALNIDLMRAEQISSFRLLPYELSEASGELTPLLQVKRDVVAEKFSYLIDEMYE